MKNNSSQKTNIFNKITKVSLVIYCLIALVLLIVFLTMSMCSKNYTYLYGFLLCLAPGFIFVFISAFLPFERIVQKGTSKGFIAWYVVAYIIKYALVIGMPILGIFYSQYFNRWSMLAITVVAPISVIVIKIIIANIVSKNNKTNEEKPKNTIKF